MKNVKFPVLENELRFENWVLEPIFVLQLDPATRRFDYRFFEKIWSYFRAFGRSNRIKMHIKRTLYSVSALQSKPLENEQNPLFRSKNDQSLLRKIGNQNVGILVNLWSELHPAFPNSQNKCLKNTYFVFRFFFPEMRTENRRYGGFWERNRVVASSVFR